MWTTARKVYRYRGLLTTLTVRELKARYRGSWLGYVWSLVNPLLLLAVYTLVFDVILGARDEGAEPYAVFLISGLFPWIWFSTALLEGTVSLTANAGLIRRAVFPGEVLPLIAVFANLVHFLLALPIVAGALLVSRSMGYEPGGVAALLFPVVVLLCIPFLGGITLALSALQVHFKDVRDLLNNMLTLLFFLAPIIYSMSRLEQIHAALPWVVRANPFTHFLEAFQAVLFFDRVPPLSNWMAMVGIGAGFWAFGSWIFGRLADTLGEAV